MLIFALACSSPPSTPSPPAAPPPSAPQPAPVDLSGSSEELCKRLSSLQPPAQDLPGDAERASLDGCDAEDLYYGISSQRDPVLARKCAYLEREKADEAPIFGGSAVLMMVYANGLGVPRNEPLAIHFACEVGGAPFEIEGRVAHLVERSKAASLPDELDLCDDITSGFMMGACSAHAQRLGAEKTDAREKAALDKLSREAREEASALMQAAGEFFRARVENEVDLSGTGRAAFQISEEEALRESLIVLFERAGDPSWVPEAGPAELKAADKALNEAYQKIVSQGDAFSYGTVTAEGVRLTERAWIGYRDAVAAFGVKARPGSKPETWKAWITQERTKQLEELSP